ncbi:MAG: formate dehydrogenase accessory sulfurtransferase FdhD [Bradyrhizobiaceae bacterium]|nr:formate dehydrogenase accessory sulfurtransferase FdhD [Bradyrhizobiaceae bacterium]
MPPPVQRVARTAWRASGRAAGERAIPEETAVAFTYNGVSYAVMMATPQDLEDFALGFSLTEGIVASASEIESLEIVEEEIGIELRMRLSEPRAQEVAARRRHLAGPTGCGLCGVETLAEAMRPAPVVGEGIRFAFNEVMRATQSISPLQTLNRETRAVHAAAFWQQGKGIVALREDLGRHNALDKLAGVLAKESVPGASGMVLLTSRVSVEMMQKAAVMGTGVVVAVSAPTALAVRTAEAAGITLAAIARDDGFEVFTHPRRIVGEQAAHVA